MPTRRKSSTRAETRTDTDAVPLAPFLAELGFSTPDAVALARAAIVEGGLSSRPDRPNIHPSKLDAVESLLAEHFIPVCPSPACQATAATDRRRPVPVPLQDCAVCGGSRNATAVRRLVDRLAATNVREVVVLGGAPGSRTELRRLWRDTPVRLELVDGTAPPDTARAEATGLRGDIFVIWATTMLDHKVSKTYQNFAPKKQTITVARRSIAALADGIVEHIEGRADLRR